MAWALVEPAEEGRRPKKSRSTGRSGNSNEQEGHQYQRACLALQELERKTNGQATEPRIYGNGIDEMVQLEKIDEGTNLTHAPVYDAKGNLALLTDANGKTVERAETSTYGQRNASGFPRPPARDDEPAAEDVRGREAIRGRSRNCRAGIRSAQSWDAIQDAGAA